MKPKTSRRQHQEDLFHVVKDMSCFMVWWTMGLGKTKIMIDIMIQKFQTGQANAMLVVAPNGVPRNWAHDEFPKHVPDEMLSQMDVYVFESKGADARMRVRERRQFLKPNGKFKILLMGFQATLTTKGNALARALMKKYDVLGVVDEGQCIKSCKGSISTRVVSYGRHCSSRFLLTGTPITNNPFDLIKQVEFVDPEFWKKHGLHPASVFKAYFGKYQMCRLKAGGTFLKPVGYKNIDELRELMKTISHRLTMESAGIDLPPRSYTKRYFELSPKTRKVYDEFEKELQVVLPETGDLLETEHHMVMLIRLQQICCGFVSPAQGEPVQRIDSASNPRMDLLMETIESCGDTQQIIWAKWKPDIEEIAKRLGKRAVRYDGSIGADDRERNKHAFRDGAAQFFVGSEAAGGTGLDGLQVARYSHYYATTYNWGNRNQSESRAWRMGQTHKHLYFDYVASNTWEERILQNLREKLDISNKVLGDKERDWI